MLLFVGVELWFLVMHGLGIRPGQPLMIAIAALLAMIRPIARGIARALDFISHPSPSTRAWTMAGIFLAANVILYWQAVHQKRDFRLRYQDEYSYRIQTRMAASGRLWEPAHPLAEFFECFQVIATPAYASTYFPGAAMLYAPGIWLGAPHWFIPLMASAGCVALTYGIFTELIDGLAGLLGALLLASISIFREQSIMVMAEVPALLGALLLIWLYLHWRQSRRLWLTAMMGIVAGWLAITRPVDALTAIIPVSIAILFDLRRVPMRRRLVIVAVGIAGMLPFVVIQLLFNLRVTGHLTETPFDFYTRQALPGSTYGFHGADKDAHSSWPLPQVQLAYENLANGLLREHTPGQSLTRWAKGYLADTIHNITPHSLLIMLMPAGLLGLRGRRWLIAGMLPLFVALYFPYVFFIRHYSVIVMPAGMLLVVLGVRELSDFSQMARPQVLTFLVALLVPLVISEWPSFDRFAADEFVDASALRQVDASLAALPHRPAIVLFHFSPDCNLDMEPVYNADVRWPDDAPVIRAHDRGENNIALFRYYAHRQPGRWVYLYNRSDGTIRDLGPVERLAESSR